MNEFLFRLLLSKYHPKCNLSNLQIGAKDGTQI